MLGRIYLDLGDRLTGDRNPPEPVTILTRWAEPPRNASAPTWPWLVWHGTPGRSGPRNVAVRRVDGTTAVVTTRRGRYWRLRIPREPVDLDAFPMHVHRACDYPGCPALMDAVASLCGEPGPHRGWMQYPSFSMRMCGEHADAVWNNRTHIPERAPARVGAPLGEPPAWTACSCGHPLPGGPHATTAVGYRAHLESLETSRDGGARP